MGGSYEENRNVPIDIMYRYIEMADIERQIEDMKAQNENAQSKQ